MRPLNGQHANNVVTSSVRESENVAHEGIRGCSWQSLRTPELHEQDELVQEHSDKVELLNGGGLARHTVRSEVCSKSMASPGVDDRQKTETLESC